MFLNSGRTYPKAMATFRVKQQVVRTPKITGLPVVKSLFMKRIARPAVVILAVMLGLNLLMSSMVHSTAAKTEVLVEVRHELVDENIALNTESLALHSDKTIWATAGERLSLVKPEGHKYTFSR